MCFFFAGYFPYLHVLAEASPEAPVYNEQIQEQNKTIYKNNFIDLLFPLLQQLMGVLSHTTTLPSTVKSL